MPGGPEPCSPEKKMNKNGAILCILSAIINLKIIILKDNKSTTTAIRCKCKCISRYTGCGGGGGGESVYVRGGGGGGGWERTAPKSRINFRNQSKIQAFPLTYVR